ncbi:MAG: sulfotransferase family protein [Geminicoccaceae bacterium]
MSRLWVHGPNLFIVGAPKCGTTSMAAYLDQHPDIYFAARKEPFFFSTDLPHAKAVTAEEDYLSLFEEGASSRYRAEGTTWYLYSKRATEAIHELCPDARIIVMLRDPIDLIVSQFQYNLLNGNEDLETIEQALAAEPARRDGKKIPGSNRIEAALHYTAMVDFAPQIERYQVRFGEDRVHVILFDDLKADTAATVRTAFDFLDLPDIEKIDLAPENETGKMTARRFGGLYRSMVSKRGLMGRAKRLLPQSVKSAVWKGVDGLNRAAGDRSAKLELAPACRSALSDRLRPGVDRLAAFLGRDLSHWAQSVPGNAASGRPESQNGTTAGSVAP